LPEEPPSFVTNNPWTKILSERGKDDGKPVLTNQPPSEPSQTEKKHTENLPATSKPKSQRQIKKRRALVLRLASIGLDSDQIQQALAGEGIFITSRSVRNDLVKLNKELESIDRKHLGYSIGASFAELSELWREAWTSYHNPDMEAGFLKLGALRELRNLHRSKTRLAGLDPGLGLSTEITAFVSPFFSGVKITTSTDIDSIVRDGGIEYVARIQDPARTND
jgi:hypothetical protein